MRPKARHARRLGDFSGDVSVRNIRTNRVAAAGVGNHLYVWSLKPPSAESKKRPILSPAWIAVAIWATATPSETAVNRTRDAPHRWPEIHNNQQSTPLRALSG
jgi:hypothetical protein